MRRSDQRLFYRLSEQVPACFDSDICNAVFPVAQSTLSKHKWVQLRKTFLLISQPLWQHHKPVLEVMNWSFVVCVTFTANEMPSLMAMMVPRTRLLSIMCMAPLQVIKICIFLEGKILLVVTMPFHSVFSRALVSPVEIIKINCYMGQSHACCDLVGRLIVLEGVQTYNFIFFEGA